MRPSNLHCMLNIFVVDEFIWGGSNGYGINLAFRYRDPTAIPSRKELAMRCKAGFVGASLFWRQKMARYATERKNWRNEQFNHPQ